MSRKKKSLNLPRKRVLYGWAARDREGGKAESQDRNGVDLFFHPDGLTARAPRGRVRRTALYSGEVYAQDGSQVEFLGRRGSSVVGLCAEDFKKIVGFLPKPASRQRVRVTVEFLGAPEQVTKSERR